MKFIGQYIQSFIARFRNDVYLEDIDTGTIASGGHLGLDSNNKIVKAVDGGGDLTGITAGTGLSGTDLTGPVPTLNVDAAQTGVTSLGTLNSLAVTSASDLGSPAITLTNADVDQIALDINASNTTANIVDINATALTSGSAIKVQGNDQHTESLLLVNVSDNETGDSSGTPRALIESKVTKTGVVASTKSRFIYGIKSTITDSASNHANSAVSLTAFTGTVDSASTSGFNYNTGLDLTVTDATYNTGISLKVEDGGDDIVIQSSADTGDRCIIATTTHGATTITTVDDDTAAAHFEIAADGDITLDAAGQIKLEPGTSVLWDGQDLTGIQDSSESFSDDDVSLMTSAAVNDRIESFGYTTNTGDITAVSFITDSGGGDKAEDASGSAEFSILGATGVGVTNSGATITAVAVPGEIDHDSLLNFDANRHFTQASITTVGTIGTGVWQGTAINKTYIDGDQRNIHSVGTIGAGTWRATPIEHDYIGGDAIDGDNIADDSVNSEHYVDGSIDTAHIADDQVTFAKAQGVTPNVFGNVIKLIPSDFMANDDGGNTKFGIGYVDDGGANTYGMRAANAATELYAFVSIPQGMTATHVDIHDKNNLAVEVFEVQIDGIAMTSKGSGNANTTIDITDVASTATNFLAIRITVTAFSGGSGDRIYGGTVTIA